MTQTHLGKAIEDATSMFGRFGDSYPVYVEPPPDAETVPARVVLADESLVGYFERAILEWTSRPAEEDVRAAASRFARRYCGSVVSAGLISLAHGVAFDVSLDRVDFLIRSQMPMGVVLDLDGADIFLCPERPTAWPVSGTEVSSVRQLRDRAFRSLFANNLVPAFLRVRTHASVAQRLLWATAAEQIDMLYSNADTALAPVIHEALRQDRRSILFSETVAGIEGANPMLDVLTWEDPDDPSLHGPLQVRRICCVCYVIPGRVPAYCRTCGLLSPEERRDLWRSWRDRIAAS